MKALSIRQPWADMILHGEKKEEYRTWQTTYRGPLLICSSLSKADLEYPEDHDLPRGVAICVVDLVDIVYNKDEGDYEWHLDNVVKVEGVPVKGRLSLYEVDNALIIR